jgi:hypothetical protein
MTREEMKLRFEELDAGRALGDLDASESAEWMELAEQLGCVADEGFDRLAAELEAEMGGALVAVPSALRDRLGVHEPLRVPAKITFGPWIGWAAAACLTGLLLFDRRGGGGSGTAPASDLRDALIRDAEDSRTLRITGTTGDFSQVKGEVVWSDERQVGYMTLVDLPPNDPSIHQYQLWIVDPARDEFPVDGGVFNMPPGGTTGVIPIDAKLAVKRPAAFVITREKPGGVVRSAQEVLVAVAKR